MVTVPACGTCTSSGLLPRLSWFHTTRSLPVERSGLYGSAPAETENVVEHAIAKRRAKRADWIVANDVSGDVMGGRNNRVHLVTGEGVEDWPEAAKEEVARHLMARIAEALG